jgi:hypothetical protein
MNQSITYNIFYNSMNDHQWRLLSEAYSSLPFWKGFDSNDCPCWFGHENQDEEYLWASIEPSGFLISGFLNDISWREWKCNFEETASSILGFKVHDAEE